MHMSSSFNRYSWYSINEYLLLYNINLAPTYQFWDVFASTKNNILVQTFAVYFQKS